MNSLPSQKKTPVPATVSNSGRTLAIDGGQAIRTKPFPAWPSFAADEIAAAEAVLRSGRVNYWTGDAGKQFEKEFANQYGAEFGITLANGTVALELALAALGVGPGDEVIVTPRTFIASSSCVVMRGATPIFADIDPITQNIEAHTVAPVLSPRTKAIIPVHLGGWPCDMERMMELAGQHKIFVIEDCAQAQGAKFRGRPVGSFGHAAAFSFCQDKIMTTAGEGGMLLTNNQALWRDAWAFKDHGKDFDTVFHRAHPPGFRWLHGSFGTNWRMTEIQSAIGRAVLPKVAGWVEQRRENAARLATALRPLPGIRFQTPPPDVYHAYYRFYVELDTDLLTTGWTRDRVMSAIAAEGVPCLVGSCSEIYQEQAFQRAKLAPAQRLPNAAHLGARSLCFLTHHTAGDADMADVARAVEKVLSVAVSH